MKNIPVLHVQGKSLAEAYEKALIELYTHGGRMSTQYDKVGDPQSIDCSMNMTIEYPLEDPMIHKAFPGGISDLREYVYELCGLKDSWTKNINDPKDTRWEYTYHGRLVNYGQRKELRETPPDDADLQVDGAVYPMVSVMTGNSINQIEIIVDKLIKSPFTRQAQAILWNPFEDNNCYDPACWQSLWTRITEEDGIQYLNTNIRFRSNDAWNACLMNMFGITIFIKENIMDEYSKRTGKDLRMGRMNWQADSWHIYGKDIQQAKERLFDRIATTKFNDRTYNFYDPEIQDMYHECEKDILKKVKDKTEEFKNTYDK